MIIIYCPGCGIKVKMKSIGDQYQCPKCYIILHSEQYEKCKNIKLLNEVVENSDDEEEE